MRGKNQQQVIEAIIHKLSSPTNLLNYQNILKSLSGAFQTNANASEISVLMNQQLNSMHSWQVESVSADGAGKTAATYSMGNMPLYVMEPDVTSLNGAKQKIQQYQVN
jgi:anionic cell wall polymer biosynthesis LytR-Cps2A-Psr (LCP) family protein